MPAFDFTVPGDCTKSTRIDKYVSEIPGGISRSHLKACATEILVNGKDAKLSHKISAGDSVQIRWQENIPQDIEPEDIPLRIIYEDSDVCVIDKEQGMVVHPAAGNWSGTLVSALLWRYKKSAIQNAGDETQLRPGIVHRLDKDTSGVMITAKNHAAQEFLSAQFRNHRTLIKEYICICTGRPPHQHGLITAGLVRDPKDRKRFVATQDDARGRRAVTAYKCIACYGNYSLMKVRIYTGRTHQIRAHMRFLNCPVLGDPVYGRRDPGFPSASLMLHSYRLTITLPGHTVPSVFRAPEPERFRKTVAVLRKRHKKFIMPKDY
ncbi:MAG: RluA family pseudouridine synthase [Treponema sp.]|nr:RluA family pseudouridine synthase [Treponema sp.]